MKVVSKILLAISIVLLISSCSSNSKEELQYFSFKVSQSDKWGIIDGKGNVVVEDEFSNQPLIVKDGMFFVPNDEGLLYLYSIEQPTKEIDVNFKQAGSFYGGLAPTVKKDGCIKFINKRGDEVFELAPEYSQATSFIKGWSMVKKETDSSEVDVFVNTKGEIFESSKYHLKDVVADNVFLAEKGEKTYLINSKEEELFGFSESTSNTLMISFSEDLKYYTFKDGDSRGLKKIDGEVVVRAKYKDLEFADKYLIFTSDFKYYGIMNTDGEVIIKEKYKRIYTIKNDMFVAAKDDYDEKGLLNMDEDKLLKFEYSDLYPISGTDFYVAKKRGDKSIYIINKDGDPISKKAEFGDLEIMSGDYLLKNWLIESDFLDVDNVVKTIFEPSENSNYKNLYGNKGKNPVEVSKNYSKVSRYDIMIDGAEYFPPKKKKFKDFDITSFVGCDVIFGNGLGGEMKICDYGTCFMYRIVVHNLSARLKSKIDDLKDDVSKYLEKEGFKLIDRNRYENSNCYLDYFVANYEIYIEISAKL